MNRLFCSILIFLLVLKVSGQINDPMQYRHTTDIDSGQTAISSSFDLFVSSNLLSNKFVMQAYQGAYLDNEIKSYNKPSENNFLGYEQNSVLAVTSLPYSLFGRRNTGFRVSVSDHIHLSTRFPQDLYQVGMYGNSSYAGDTAFFSNTTIQYTRYQAIQFGLFKKHYTEREVITSYGGISILKGQSLNSVTVEEGKLFTEETGDYIDLQLDGTYISSDTGKTRMYHFNGLGAALNFYVQYENKVKHFSVQASANNLGNIHWNRNSIRIPIDTILHYEGYSLSDGFNMDSSNNSLSVDSLLVNLMKEADSIKVVKVLPERIYVSFTKGFYSDRLLTTLGISGIFNGNMKLPLFYGIANYKFSNNFSTWISAAYGGYSGFQAGLGISVTIKNRLQIKAGSHNIIGIIAPENSYTQAAYGSITLLF